MDDDFLVRTTEPVEEQPNHVDERDRRTSAVIPRNVLVWAYDRCGYDSRTQCAAATDDALPVHPVGARVLVVQRVWILRVHAGATTGHVRWTTTDSLRRLLNAVARHVQKIQRLADRDSLADTSGNRVLVINGIAA